MNAINLPSKEACMLFGRAFARQLSAGDVVLLDGKLGAGKTTFAQALLAGLGVADARVTSPTFTLLQRYDVTFADGSAGECVHADLYRLKHADELVELGLDEVFGTDICLIEWPSRLGTLMPARYIYCGIDANHASQARQFTLRVHGYEKPAMERWLKQYEV